MYLIGFGVFVFAMIAACALFFKAGQRSQQEGNKEKLALDQELRTQNQDHEVDNRRLEFANRALVTQLNKLYLKLYSVREVSRTQAAEYGKLNKSYGRLYRDFMRGKEQIRLLEETLNAFMPAQRSIDLEDTTILGTDTVSGSTYIHPIPTEDTLN